MAIREFINELGNTIIIEVVKGDPGKMCRYAILGPDTTTEGYVTLMELQHLGDAICQALQS